MITSDLGKRMRMRRIMRNGRILVLPFDHPIYFGPVQGVEDPAKLAVLARDNGATAVLLTAGALRQAAPEIGDLGVIMRIDATVSRLGGPDTVMHLLHDVEEASSLGADMVVVNCFLGIGDTDIEHDLLVKLADVSAQCDKMGMPLCGEIIPRVTYKDLANSMPTSEDMAIAMRFGLEYGCDLVKTVYNGDKGGYAKAISSCHLPVILAGGPKSDADDDTAIFRHLREFIDAGGCGAAVGRRVWGSDRPEATLKAVKSIVIDDVSLEEAVATYME